MTEQKETRGRPRGWAKTDPDVSGKGYKDRFEKHYFTHREKINKKRRDLYKARKALCVCVRCAEKLSKDSKTFCKAHHEASKRQLFR